MEPKTKPRTGRWKWVLPVFAVPIFFADNLYGTARHSWLCAADAGWHVPARLEPNAGLLVQDRRDADALARLEGVGFVRTQVDGQWVDIKYVGTYPAPLGGLIQQSPADPSRQPRYLLESFREEPSASIRTARHVARLIDDRSASIAAEWIQYAFGLFDQRRTIFGAPSSAFCRNKPDFVSSESSAILFGINRPTNTP